MSFGYSNTQKGADHAKRNAAMFDRLPVRDLKAEKLAEARLLTDAGWDDYCKANEGVNTVTVRGIKRRRMERMKQLTQEGYAELIHWRNVDIEAETRKGDDVAVARMCANWEWQDAQLTALAAMVGIQYPPVMEGMA